MILFELETAMASIKNFEDLEIWQLARKQSQAINQLISDKRLKNDFGLINQIRNSSGSVMDNIAEGFDREGNKEFINFLSIAKGSNAECRSQFYRCYDNSYITQEELDVFVGESKNTWSKNQKFYGLPKKFRIQRAKI